jgi:serine/threonine protein kinase
MDYKLLKVKFDLIDFNINSKSIINLKLHIITEVNINIFTIKSFLGNGVMGQVYLLENTNHEENESIFPSDKYVLKISNEDSYKDLKNELVTIQNIFTKHKIKSDAYPIGYGKIENVNTLGVLYNFIGYYNLDRIKKINYKIDFETNIMIIRQLIEQLMNMNNIIHCDLKPANIVVNTIDDTIKATIIDYGLLKTINDFDVISTNYITSPESLLTIKSYGIKKIKIDLSKHDYFGLFVTIINLFVKTNYWVIINKYLSIDNNIKDEYLLKDEARILYGYLWYRFNYDKVDDISNKHMKHLIVRIEKSLPEFFNKKFGNYEYFFTNHILPNINYDCIDKRNINELKSFLRELSYFCPENRPSYKILLIHPFLN